MWRDTSSPCVAGMGAVVLGPWLWLRGACGHCAVVDVLLLQITYSEELVDDRTHSFCGRSSFQPTTITCKLPPTTVSCSYFFFLGAWGHQ